MDSVPEPLTRASLLGRLRAFPNNQQYWGEFVSRYGPLIHRWCRKRGFQEEDAQDLTQEVLSKLYTELQRFTYDPSRRFRAWLRTVTARTWTDLVRIRKRRVATIGGSAALQGLASVEARDDLLRRMEEEYDLELYEHAKEAVRQRVEHRTWEAFRLQVEEAVTPQEVALRLGMQVAMVYVARSKVQQKLKEEVARLEEMENEP